jgi:hypothetical protein
MKDHINDKDKRKVNARLAKISKDTKDWGQGYLEKIDDIQKRFAAVLVKYDAKVESKIIDDLRKLENIVDTIKKKKSAIPMPPR